MDLAILIQMVQLVQFLEFIEEHHQEIKLPQLMNFSKMVTILYAQDIVYIAQLPN